MQRPIIFSGPMVRALLDGRKTQTRRVINTNAARRGVNLFDGTWSDNYVLDPGNAEWRQRHVRYAPGDLLWVRENWAVKRAEPCLEHERDYQSLRRPVVRYLADGTEVAGDGIYHGPVEKGRPSIHMPRWASRLTLEVTGVKVERLNDISEADARAEGAFVGKATGRVFDSVTSMRLGGPEWRNCRDWFADLWDSINGKRDGANWAANPWVVAVTFTVHRCNVDAFTGAEG